MLDERHCIVYIREKNDNRTIIFIEQKLYKWLMTSTTYVHYGEMNK